MSDMIKDLSGFRMSYEKGELLEQDMFDNPHEQFMESLNLALYQGLYEPYAMSLATVDIQGYPHTRILLLRGASPKGYDFFSHYDSQKGKALELNPYGEMLFFWGGLETQVRIFGKIEKLSEEESLEYFHKRPRGSQIAAHVSKPQSGLIESREALEQRFEHFKTQFGDGEIPKPDNWGGYRLVPERYEFWQGRPNRLHDRIVYKLQDGVWHMSRIMP